jgi:hypothetical protein
MEIGFPGAAEATTFNPALAEVDSGSEFNLVSLDDDRC